MSSQLSIICGAETQPMNDGNPVALQLAGWAPRAAQPDRETTSETVNLIVHRATDHAAIVAAIQSIEELVATRAPERQRTGTGERVYVAWKPHGTTTTWYWELLEGMVSIEPKALDPGWWEYNTSATLRLTWTRKNLAEDSITTQLGLTNSHGTDDTSGLQIDNTDDSTRDNWFSVDGADVTGTAPAPARLELTNTFVGDDVRTVYVGHMTARRGDPANFTPALEAEDATRDGVYASSTATADASASGGYYVSVAALPATSVDLFTWTISSAQLGYAGHEWFHVVARFHTKPSNGTISARLGIKVGSTVLGAPGQQIVLNTADALQSLGVLQIPPALRDATGLAPLSLILSASDSAASGTFALDYIMLLPTASWRKLEPASVDDVDNAEVLVLDEIDDMQYVIQAGGKSPHYLVTGTPLMLVPGVDQRIYILHDDSSGNAGITRTMTAKLYYRPRTATV